GLRHLPARRPRARRGDRPAALPPDPERGPRPRRRGADPGLARPAGRGRVLHRVLPARERRGARRLRGRRAGEAARARGGGGLSVELIDELEAGELSVEFEGEEPEALLEWALERFSPRIAISTAFQNDGVALLDMAYRIDPEVRIFSVDTGRLPQETFDLIEQLRERYPGLNLDLLVPNAR